MSVIIYPSKATHSRSIQSRVWIFAKTGFHEYDKVFLSRRGRRLPRRKGLSSFDQVQSIEPVQASFESCFVIDDTETRKKVWNLFFGDRPPPEPEENAVEKYYGILDKFIDKKKASMETLKRIIEES